MNRRDPENAPWWKTVWAVIFILTAYAVVSDDRDFNDMGRPVVAIKTPSAQVAR